MAEANINVRVNAQKARQDLNLTTESVENLTVNVAIQQQKIAEANQEVVKYTRLLSCSVVRSSLYMCVQNSSWYSFL